MLRGAGGRVEEHQEQHHPIEEGGLHRGPARLPDGQVNLAQLLAVGEGGGRRDEDDDDDEEMYQPLNGGICLAVSQKIKWWLYI